MLSVCLWRVFLQEECDWGSAVRGVAGDDGSSVGWEKLVE